MNRTDPKRQIPLDDLPDTHVEAAVKMLKYLQRRPMRYFVKGSPSGNFAEILERAGYMRLQRVMDGSVELLKVLGVPK